MSSKLFNMSIKKYSSILHFHIVHVCEIHLRSDSKITPTNILKDVIKHPHIHQVDNERVLDLEFPIIEQLLASLLSLVVLVFRLRKCLNCTPKN